MSGWEVLPIVTPISFARSVVSSTMITGLSRLRPALMSRPTFAWRGLPRHLSDHGTWQDSFARAMQRLLKDAEEERRPSLQGDECARVEDEPLTRHARRCRSCLPGAYGMPPRRHRELRRGVPSPDRPALQYPRARRQRALQASHA